MHSGAYSDWVMLVTDEASGVDEEVFEAAAGSMSGGGSVGKGGAVTLLLVLLSAINSVQEGSVMNPKTARALLGCG